MANLIQIKRSLTTATAPSLANGELAFTANGDHLFIGSNGATITIAGKFNPGVLTANQALVANGSGYLDAVKTANLTVRSITANGVSSPGDGYLLSVDAGGNTYWLPQSSISINTAAQFTWTNTHAFTANVASSNNTTGTIVITGGLGVSGRINTGDLAVGANVVVTNTGISVGNSTVNTAITSTSIDTDGTLAVLGATTLSNTVSAAGLASLNAGLNTTTANASSAVNVGANVNIDTGKITVGNSTVNTAITSSGIDTDGTLAVLGATTLSSTLAAGNTTITGFAYVSGQVNAASHTIGTSFVANTTALNVNTNATFTSNVTLGSDSADVIVFNGETTGNIVPSANVTYNLGALNDRFNYVYAANVHATRGYFEGTVEIQGDLFVSGNVTTVNVSSLEVVDSLIYLAGNNYTSDLIDIGFVGNYYDGSVQRHTGIIRHAADNQYYIFTGYTAEPDNNVVDVGNTSLGYQQATLNAYLRSGGIYTNSTYVAITANASVAVAITANTLNLDTALPATDGGTGYDSYTSGDILVANSGNAFSKLALGSDGYVLQSNGTAVVYNTLDGGTF